MHKDGAKLSQEQRRVLEAATRNGETLAISPMSLVEIAMLAIEGRLVLGVPVGELFADLRDDPAFELIPINFDIARDAGALRMLRDPADRVIVATARVHGLKLLTSDQRIVDSGLVETVD